MLSPLVVLVNEILQAYAFTVAQQMSVFIGLIITDCIVMGREEGFAMKNGVKLSMLDGLGKPLVAARS